MRKKVFCIAAALLFTGCNVYMTPDYQANLQEASEAISDLNDNCQSGDDTACREGLKLADETVKLFLQEAEGR